MSKVIARWSEGSPQDLECKRKERERLEQCVKNSEGVHRAFGKGTKIYHTSDGQRVDTRSLDIVTK